MELKELLVWILHKNIEIFCFSAILTFKNVPQCKSPRVLYMYDSFYVYHFISFLPASVEAG